MNPRRPPEPADPTRSAATQPYRTTRAAQQVSRRLIRPTIDPTAVLLEQTDPDGARTYTAPYRCISCKTPHATQLDADICCPANELSTSDALEILARELGRRL